MWTSGFFEKSRALADILALEKILKESIEILDRSRHLMAPEDVKRSSDSYLSFCAPSLYRTVITMKSGIEMRGLIVLFKNKEEKGEFYKDLLKLRLLCEGYRDDILTTSQRAQRAAEALAFASTSTIDLPAESEPIVLPVTSETAPCPVNLFMNADNSPTHLQVTGVTVVPLSALPSLAQLSSGTSFLMAGIVSGDACSIAWDINAGAKDGPNGVSRQRSIDELTQLSRERISTSLESNSSHVFTDSYVGSVLAGALSSVLSASLPRL
ncbi:unnamed protein product [Rhizoctonia solani]|uniref:Uncharacterized protein n=1 Tax=Rhizoctonia solani TaxID=456999 RepID=A0A8H3H7R5_9AGAM|nr:unnamed protein product [Rhizoctonia solani]